MKKTTGSKMILVGGILELVIAVFGVVVLALFLSKASTGLMEQLHISPETGLKAMFGFYGCIALHIIAVVVAFISQSKTERYMPALVVGILLIVFTNLTTDWSSSSFITAGLNTLPGALIGGGAYANMKAVKK